MLRLILPYLLCLSAISAVAQKSYSASTDTLLMGVSFSFTAVSDSEQAAQHQLTKGINEVIRIEKLISSWDVNSQTSNINSMAGVNPVQVDLELIKLIERAAQVSRITNGHYDISVIPLIQLWGFQTDEAAVKLPSDEEISNIKRLVNAQSIQINREEQSIFLPIKEMKIGFGSIGKGYAADMAKLKMQAAGAYSGVVNAGGDILCWGNKPDETPWTIGIADPKNKNEVIAWLDISDAAVVTSGDYEKFITIDNKDYCHIIDAVSGKPVLNMSSVTIICAGAEAADALATSVFILGKEEGLKLINHLNDIECIIIDENQEIHFSDNVNEKYIFVTHE